MRIIGERGAVASPTETVEFSGMTKRAALYASLLVLLSPFWVYSARAQEGPVATAPIPPPVHAAPDRPMLVPLKPSGEVKPNGEAKAASPAKHEATATPHPAPLRNGARSDRNAEPAHAARPGSQAEKKTTEAKKSRDKRAEEKKAEAARKADEAKKVDMKKREAQARTAERRRVVRRRWVVRERRWEPPPPFGPSWYQRYPPYPRMMPPMTWDD